eukprot:4715393-Pyramimonas_sp.AAC.1
MGPPANPEALIASASSSKITPSFLSPAPCGAPRRRRCGIKLGSRILDRLTGHWVCKIGYLPPNSCQPALLDVREAPPRHA